MEWELVKEVKLLIVEDDMFNRMLIKSSLAKIKNINILEAKDGIEALEILDQQSIDICLLDLHMPKMNGFETLKSIRKSLKYKNLSVIVTTSDEIEKKTSLALGANDFIAKPFHLEELQSKIYQQLISR
jgi:CheY-like chemotaxis protein